MFKSTNLRSSLGRARGLGSAKDGLHHWWGQRLTALALIPLTLWFVTSVIMLTRINMGFEGAVFWLASPFHATALVLFIAVGFHHAVLGMQVVLEDYVSSHGARTVSIILVKFICYSLATLAIVSTLIVTLGG